MNRILILDYGSQFTQLIARRIREASVYCEIHPASKGSDLAFIRGFDPKGIILSGGPNSVFDPGAPTADAAILDLGPPVRHLLRMQLVARLAGGVVPSSEPSTVAPKSRSGNQGLLPDSSRTPRDRVGPVTATGSMSRRRISA